MHIIDRLKRRGFFKQSTNEDALRRRLDAGPVTFYIGFDPTADSLHVGHLVQVMAMSWLQKAGHRAVALIGGGTAMVGDPTGKDRTRQVLSTDDIAANSRRFAEQLSGFLDLDGERGVMVNNADWLLGLEYVAFLREIGSHFSVSRMLSAEGTQQRLEREQGMNFVEFNYHLLQSYDYLVLHRRHGCTLQVGGDDQWFNIVGGVGLVRRVDGHEVMALTTPLLTTADGKKMGKTEKGAVFLAADRVTPFDYYQYWINRDDRDVGRLLRLFTFLPEDEIARLEALRGAEIRTAKRALAFEAPPLWHGRSAAAAARDAAAALFSGRAAADVPTHLCVLPASVVDVLTGSGLCKSKSMARRMITQGGVRVGSAQVSKIDAVLAEEAIVWAGKKRAVQVRRG